MDDNTYTAELCRRFLEDGTTPSYENLGIDEISGVVGDIIRNDPAYGWEILQNVDPKNDDDNVLPLLMADILTARGDCEWDKINEFAATLVAHMMSHCRTYCYRAVNDTLEETLVELDRNAREAFDEDDGRGDYLYQTRKDDALTGDL